MNETLDNSQIFVSGRIWHEIHPKVSASPFVYALQGKIDLSEYGDAIQKFYFTFLVVKPTNKIHHPYKHYDRKTKEADISVRIPYGKIENATQAETFQLMEAAYLKGIDQLATLRLNGTFDVVAFKKDVEAIFAKDRWYEQVSSLEV